jgi:hypothetical protein
MGNYGQFTEVALGSNSVWTYIMYLKFPSAPSSTLQTVLLTPTKDQPVTGLHHLSGGGALIPESLQEAVSQARLETLALDLPLALY